MEKILKLFNVSKAGLKLSRFSKKILDYKVIKNQTF